MQNQLVPPPEPPEPEPLEPEPLDPDPLDPDPLDPDPLDPDPLDPEPLEPEPLEPEPELDEVLAHVVTLWGAYKMHWLLRGGTYRLSERLNEVLYK